MAAPPSLRYAHIGHRLPALLVDAAIVAVLFVILVTAVNAFVAQWDERWLEPLWSPPSVVNVRAEPVGKPDPVKYEDGTERTTAFSRETRIYDDGSVRIFAVIEATVVAADGTVTSGRTEGLIGESSASYWRLRATYAALALVALVYAGVFEASRYRATPGKRLLGLAVVDLAGQPLSPARAALRQVTKLATLAMSGFGYLTALFTQRKQTMHDLLAGTIVVYARAPRVGSRRI